MSSLSSLFLFSPFDCNEVRYTTYDNYRCFKTTSVAYKGASCNWKVLKDCELDVLHFNTEQDYDYFVVNGKRYSGAGSWLGPDGVFVAKGEIMSFDSGMRRVNSGTGFDICGYPSNGTSSASDSASPSEEVYYIIAGLFVLLLCVLICACLFKEKSKRIRRFFEVVREISGL